eukprot:CAMPEP_0183736718 /NCGR_PEP_ID=MMETSP0737-20130205/50077_1 /TAXON_ID=385413 /ORGANISM="Thalassiosira miniscula, Strain CCMP1093" /LENGTH=252 /DNA_ID=CAMNT_0025970801 /DNA_START=94 /DNA_END=852 /DNA_ORIENTATION=+
MKQTVDDLEEEVAVLHDIEQELDDIAHEQGMNSNEIVSMVNENEHVLKRMKNHLREVALSDVARIVVSSDRNGDMMINLKELNVLTLRIKVQLDAHGVDLDEDRFKAMVRKDNDISHVLKVVGAIMFDDAIDGKNIDDYADEAQWEEARQDNLVGTLGLASVIARMRRLSSKIGEPIDIGDGDNVVDNTGMFTLQERFTQGSVDIARGTRVSLSNQKMRTQSDGRTAQIIRQTLTVIDQNPILQRAMASEVD